jgi:aminoglycoside phosphotransferase (APT) family kinase protein
MAGASLAEAELALQSIAHLHAAWWAADPAEVPELAQLVDNSQAAQQLVERLYRAAWPRFLEHATLEIPQDIRRFGENLLGRISAVEALLAHSPRTLIHGDFRLDNVLFGIREGQPACWVIDWEDIQLGNGMADVAWFLGGCLPVEESDREQELLRGYHQALIQAGVEGYSFQQSIQDYRLAMLSSFVQGILMVASLETGEDYARNLAGVLSERFMLACRRLRLADLLNYQKSP